METNQPRRFSMACGCESGLASSTKEGKCPGELTVALAGNANVGKSAIFNQLTGLNQVTGNWPGKTVERAEGTLHYKGYTIRIVDLPGTYSLSAYSMEEIVSREYLAVEKPDLIINVVDASALERNLYLTLQLLELEVPFVIALNQMDFAAKKGLRIDTEKLSKVLGVRAVPTVATTGTGITELLDAVIEQVDKPNKIKLMKPIYGKEIEERIQAIENLVVSKLSQLNNVYPARWIAIKLLEKDADIVNKVEATPDGKAMLELVDGINSELETVHGETSTVIMASERYTLASKIAKEAVTFEATPRISLEQKLAAVTTHKVYGYLILLGVVTAIFGAIFAGGSLLSGVLDRGVAWISAGSTALLSKFLPSIAVELIVKGVDRGGRCRRNYCIALHCTILRHSYLCWKIPAICPVPRSLWIMLCIRLACTARHSSRLCLATDAACQRASDAG